MFYRSYSAVCCLLSAVCCLLSAVCFLPSAQRLSMINIPATMPSMAKPVVTVDESLTLRNGKSPVRINHSPSKSIPRFLPAKTFDVAIVLLFAVQVMNQSFS
jgi:hypothetical protein